jgi:hypothetical protein
MPAPQLVKCPTPAQWQTAYNQLKKTGPTKVVQLLTPMVPDFTGYFQISEKFFALLQQLLDVGAEAEKRQNTPEFEQIKPRLQQAEGEARAQAASLQKQAKGMGTVLRAFATEVQSIQPKNLGDWKPDQQASIKQVMNVLTQGATWMTQAATNSIGEATAYVDKILTMARGVGR